MGAMADMLIVADTSVEAEVDSFAAAVAAEASPGAAALPAVVAALPAVVADLPAAAAALPAVAVDLAETVAVDEAVIAKFRSNEPGSLLI
jgi:hypothetical protein